MANPQPPAKAKEEQTCRPVDGLNAGLAGEYGASCSGSASYQYMQGRDLGMKMYKLKEKRSRSRRRISKLERARNKLVKRLRGVPNRHPAYRSLEDKIAEIEALTNKERSAKEEIDRKIENLDDDILQFRRWNS